MLFSHKVMSYSFVTPMDCRPPGSSVHDFPGKNTGADCHFFLQGIFSTQGSNLRLLHWQAGSLSLSHQGMMGESSGDFYFEEAEFPSEGLLWGIRWTVGMFWNVCMILGKGEAHFLEQQE